ncbi:hypothetical protein Trydic_g16668 [Trypoxylus dichotomus]
MHRFPERIGELHCLCEERIEDKIWRVDEIGNDEQFVIRLNGDSSSPIFGFSSDFSDFNNNEQQYSLRVPMPV